MTSWCPDNFPCSSLFFPYRCSVWNRCIKADIHKYSFVPFIDCNSMVIEGSKRNKKKLKAESDSFTSTCWFPSIRSKSLGNASLHIVCRRVLCYTNVWPVWRWEYNNIPTPKHTHTHKRRMNKSIFWITERSCNKSDWRTHINSQRSFWCFVILCFFFFCLHHRFLLVVFDVVVADRRKHKIVFPFLLYHNDRCSIWWLVWNDHKIR